MTRSPGSKNIQLGKVTKELPQYSEDTEKIKNSDEREVLKSQFII